MKDTRFAQLEELAVQQHRILTELHAETNLSPVEDGLRYVSWLRSAILRGDLELERRAV